MKYMHAEMITLIVVISAIASRLMGGMFTLIGGQNAFDLITIAPLIILLVCIIPYSLTLKKTELEINNQIRRLNNE